MRVVALVPGGISDQILFFPTVDDIKRNYPDAEIDVVVEPRAIAAYRVCKSVNDTIQFDFRDRNSPADWANLLGVIRDRYYDVALATGGGWGLGFLLWLAGTPSRIGYDQSGASLFLTATVALQSQQYQAAVYHDLLQGMGMTPAAPVLGISLPQSDLAWAEIEQKRLGVNGYVLLYGGDSPEGTDQAYPAERWRVIIQDFQQRQPDLPIVMIEGANSAKLVANLSQAFPGLKVTQPEDIGKLAAMIAAANLIICPESVAMHLAIALKVYTLALLSANTLPTTIPMSGEGMGGETRFVEITSPTASIADIPPDEILKKVWGG